MGTVNGWDHASSTTGQRDRLRTAFAAARGRDDRHLTVLAMAERNRTRTREPRRPLPPATRLEDLSSYEATLLLRRLREAEGGPPPTTCARCARIGLEPRTPCMHDAGAVRDRDEAFQSSLRRRGLIT